MQRRPFYCSVVKIDVPEMTVPEMAHLAQYCENKDLKLFLSHFLIYTLLEPSDFDKMAEIQENITKIVDLSAKIMIGQCSHEEMCKKIKNWGFL